MNETGLLDQDGYPTEGALNIIRNWWVGPDGEFDNTKTFSELMDFIKSVWWAPDYGWHETKEPHELWSEKIMNRWYISTGGWSGNEDIINAMQDTGFLWSLNWVQSRRGGHYIFEEYQFGKE
jgi:hypothetical protein